MQIDPTAERYLSAAVQFLGIIGVVWGFYGRIVERITRVETKVDILMRKADLNGLGSDE